MRSARILFSQILNVVLTVILLNLVAVAAWGACPDGFEELGRILDMAERKVLTVSYGEGGRAALPLARQNQIDAVAVTARAAFVGGNSRVRAIQGLLSDQNLLPKDGVLHVVGPGSVAEEWVLPLILRPDVKLVLSDVGVSLKFLTRDLRNDQSLRTLWKLLSDQYPEVVKGAFVRSFDDFKHAVRERVTLNEGVQNTKGVPKAHLMIFNMPHLENEAGPISSFNRPATGVLPIIRNQLVPGRGAIWVNSDGIATRMGPEFNNLPRIPLPAHLSSFDPNGLNLRPDHSIRGLDVSDVAESALLFP